MKENFFQDNPFMYHVGLDSHNNNLVSIDEVISDIEQKYKEYLEENITDDLIYSIDNQKKL